MASTYRNGNTLSLSTSISKNTLGSSAEFEEALKQLSNVTTLFSNQATDCERLYKSQAEVRRLVSDKHAFSDVTSTAQIKCAQGITELAAGMMRVTSMLENIWACQIKEIDGQTLRLESAIERVEIHFEKTTLESQGMLSSSSTNAKSRRPRKIVRTAPMAQSATEPNFTINLRGNDGIGIQPGMNMDMRDMPKITVSAAMPFENLSRRAQAMNNSSLPPPANIAHNTSNAPGKLSAGRSRQGVTSIPPPPSLLGGRGSKQLGSGSLTQISNSSGLSNPSLAVQSQAEPTMDGSPPPPPPPPPPLPPALQFGSNSQGQPPSSQQSSPIGPALGGPPPPPPPPAIQFKPNGAGPPPPPPPPPGAGVVMSPIGGAPNSPKSKPKELNLQDQLKARLQKRSEKGQDDSEVEKKAPPPQSARNGSEETGLTFQDQLRNKLKKRSQDAAPTCSTIVPPSNDTSLVIVQSLVSPASSTSPWSIISTGACISPVDVAIIKASSSNYESAPIPTQGGGPPPPPPPPPVAAISINDQSKPVIAGPPPSANGVASPNKPPPPPPPPPANGIASPSGPPPPPPPPPANGIVSPNGPPPPPPPPSANGVASPNGPPSSVNPVSRAPRTNPSPVQASAAPQEMDFQDQLKMRLKKRIESADTVKAGEPRPQPLRTFAPPPTTTETISFEDQLKQRLKKRNEVPINLEGASVDASKTSDPTCLFIGNESAQLMKPSGMYRSKWNTAKSSTATPATGPNWRQALKSVSGTVDIPKATLESSVQPIQKVEPKAPVASTVVPLVTENVSPSEEQEQEQEVIVTDDMLFISLANYDATDGDQITLVQGETIVMLVAEYGNGWSYGCSLDGTKRGIFPQTFVKKASKDQ
ncbi:hypothetical protein BSLG_002272 [Batrachochytrium salamandrivorans]|nr:hypothetical protein BSLG_002272 [Batrachochytrium salamandrivorans]